MHRVQSVYADSNSHDFVVVAALFQYAVIVDAFHPMQLTGNWFEMLWKSFLLVTSVFSLVTTGLQNCVCVAFLNCRVSFTFITTPHCYEADLLVLVWEKILYMRVVETYSIIQREWALEHRETLCIRLFLSMSIGLNEQQRLASTVFWCKDSPNVKVQLIDCPYFKP